MRFSKLQSCSAVLLLAAASACSGDDSNPGAAAGSAGSAGSAEDAASSTDTSVASESSRSDNDAAADQAAADGTMESSTQREASQVDAPQPKSCPSLPSLDGGSDGGDAGNTPEAPQNLIDTGLYCDVSSFAIAPAIHKFQPRYELWSDGAVKTRWIWFPPNTKVATSPTADAPNANMDHWWVPVGTKIWKEFKYNGKRIETRLIWRYGPGLDDILYAAYLWNADQTAATLWNPNTGADNTAPLVEGQDQPQHHVPSRIECDRCHAPLSEHILGFGAIQLSNSLGDADDWNLSTLVAANMLTDPPEAGAFDPPGSNADKEALGFFHVNCGNCHNETPSGLTNPRYVVRLMVGDTTLESTKLYQTAVNKLHTWGGAADAGLIGKYRIEGGNAAKSELFYRLSTRDGTNQQMPPIDTFLPPPAPTLQAIQDWINALPSPGAVSDGGDAGTTAGDAEAGAENDADFGDAGVE